MLKNFLSSNKTLIQNLIFSGTKQPTPNIKFVLGNESGDLDSVISSIAYAFHKTTFNNSHNYNYIPVLNFPNKEVKSRFELNFLFKAFNYDLSDLLYINTINLPE